MRRLALVVAFGCACGAKDEWPPPDLIPPAGSGSTGAAAPRGSKTQAAETAWGMFRTAHVGATPANAVDTGKRLWPLLAPDAQQAIEDMAAATVATLNEPSLKVPRADLRYALLGESAAARRELIARAELAGIDAMPDRSAGGKTTSAIKLTVRDGATALALELESVDGGPWRFTRSPDLIATDRDVFRTPAGRETSEGAPSVDALVARWKAVNAKGTGWDAYNLMSPAMRQRLLAMVARVGGTGAEDAARIFEKTLADRRARGVSVTEIAIGDRSASSAGLTVTYSQGKPEAMTAVFVNGAWWIEIPF